MCVCSLLRGVQETHGLADHWWALFISCDRTGNRAGTYRKPPPLQIPADRSGFLQLHHACYSTTQILKWFHLRRLGVHVEATVSKLWPEVNRAQGEFWRKLVNCPYTSLFPGYDKTADWLWLLIRVMHSGANKSPLKLLGRHDPVITFYYVIYNVSETQRARAQQQRKLFTPSPSAVCSSICGALIVSAAKGQRDQQLHMPSWTVWSRAKHLSNSWLYCCDILYRHSWSPEAENLWF